MLPNQTLTTTSTQHLRRLSRRIFPALLGMLTLALVGCGGSSSSSSGGAAFATSSATVTGNVSEVGDSLAKNELMPASAGDALVKLLDALTAEAQAAGVEGIQVCISDICTLTDADGNFLLDTSSLAPGYYALSILVGGVIYTYNLSQEIDGTTSVQITDMVISESGTVNVGNITYKSGEEETEADTAELLVDEPKEPAGGSVSGNISSAPDGTNSTGQDKIVLCHKPGTPAEKTLIVAEPATKGHLSHGDSLGACDGKPSGGTESDDGNGEDDNS